VNLDQDRAGWQLNFASAVDVGVRLDAKQQIAAHVLADPRREMGQTSQRGKVLPGRIGEAYPHRRRLPRGSIVDAHVHCLQSCTH
jgi:hypothetical protein